MRVLVFGHMYTEPLRRERFRHMDHSGEFDSIVVAPTLWRHTLGNYGFKPATKDEGFRIIPCKISFSGKYFKFFYHGVSRLLKKYNPDIIEIDQEPASLACYQIIRAAKRICPLSKIVVWTSEDTIEKWRFPMFYFERYTLSKIDYIIACYRDVERLLRRKGYKNKMAVFQVFGVNPDLFKPFDVSALKRELGLNGRFVIGYVGRMVEGKGLFTLVRAFASLKEARLLLVGSGDSISDLLILAKELGAADRVLHIPSVPLCEVPKYINCMNVLVLPSEGTERWREKFGYVIPQAMCCEVPVVASRHGGIPWVIGEAGLLFEPGDKMDLASKLRSLKDNKSLADKYARAGRKRALENYTVENVVQRISEVYREAMR